MICVSIQENNFADIFAKMQGEEGVEIRLDDAVLSDDEINKIFSLPIKTIATCRINKYNNIKRKDILIKAITAGASYVDIEIESDENYKQEIINYALIHHCKIIISYHNYKETPSLAKLKSIIKNSFKDKVDIVKIACKTNSKKDLSRILALYDFENKNDYQSILALGMGAIGKISRVLAPILGAPFTFVSKGKKTAEGQL